MQGNRLLTSLPALTLLLVGAALASSWLSASPVAARPGGEIAGSRVWAWLFFSCEAAALATYGLALLALRRCGTRPLVVCVLAAAIQLAPLGAPLLLSTDAWAYWDYGRIAAVHGANPYRETPQDFSADPAFRFVGRDWRDTGSVYGPAFTLASEPVAALAGESASRAAWLWKTLAALAALTAASLAGLVARDGVFALAFVGWNPVLALHAAGGGHNDAWVAALVLAAVVLEARSRRRASAAAWALAALVKPVPLLLVPLEALASRAGGRRVSYGGFAAAVAAVVGVATWRYGLGWVGSLVQLARNARGETSWAVPHRLTDLGVPHPLALGSCAAAFALAYVWLLREAWRGRARTGLAMGVLLLVTPYLAPWYLAWALPLAAAEDDRTARVLALALSAYLLPQTIPL